MEGSGYQSGLLSSAAAAPPPQGDNTSGEGERAGGGILLEEGSPSPSPSPSPSQTPSPPPPDSAAAAAAAACSGYDMMRRVAMGLAPPALAPPAGEAVRNITMKMGITQGSMGSNSSSSNILSTAKPAAIDGEVLASGKKPPPSSSSSSPPPPLPPPVLTPLTLAAPAGNTTITTLVLSSEKRTRGRPPGSGKRQLLATLGEWFAYSAGGNFAPHVITIASGEDVAARIMSFCQTGPRGICILSANGAISNVTLRQPGSSGGTLTCEGRFEILSLSGSFTIAENSGVRSRTGGISVSLAGPDGRVIGGGVAGLLLAASPIQVVVGSFLPNPLKEPKKRSNPASRSLSPMPVVAARGVLTAARPIAQKTSDDDDDDDDREIPTSTLLKHNHGELESSSRIGGQNPSSVSFHQTLGRQERLLQPPWEHKPSPDINLSLPEE